ncbi:MAG TPA: UDP-2,3-diacylglucosamine diphosphatase [Thermoanaerobaculia bacterium]|nr:UDP-2,3-diacylglucosamine diphosphatase [Thermoanaerobaculia bacterium]
MAIEKGRIFVIGDSHIGLAGGDEKRIVAWIDRLSELEPKALYLNGDVFHYFIGDPKFITSSVVAFFGRLRALRDAGTAVHYVEGNRDFFLQGSIAEASVTDISLAASFQAGSTRYLIVHGDMINDHDLPYRFWRRASKNPLTRFGVRWVPRKIARRFVDGVEKKLAGTNFKHKRRLPVELMQEYGRKKGREGYGVVVFGHFHEKLEVQADGARVVVLPAWYLDGEAMMVSPESGSHEFVTI